MSDKGRDMKKLILIILIITSLPIRAMDFATDSRNWAHSTYSYRPSLTYGQYDIRNQSMREISAANYSYIQEESTSGPRKGQRRIGREDLDDDDFAIGEDEYRSPIGDALLPLLLLVGAYALWYRRKKNTI